MCLYHDHDELFRLTSVLDGADRSPGVAIRLAAHGTGLWSRIYKKTTSSQASSVNISDTTCTVPLLEQELSSPSHGVLQNTDGA